MAEQAARELRAKAQDIEDAAFDLKAVNPNAKNDDKPLTVAELLDLIDEGKIGWDRVCELGQVLIGTHPGRTSDQQIIYYKSNTGVCIQFAAAGALIYETCRKRGLGRELPTEWFGTDLSEWTAKGFMPSP